MRGERLRYLRESRALTQEELARAVGISESQIFKYEKGDSHPRTDVVVKIAYYFGVSADYLLGLSDDPRVQNRSLQPREQAIIEAWRRGDLKGVMRVIVDDE